MITTPISDLTAVMANISLPASNTNTVNSDGNTFGDIISGVTASNDQATVSEAYYNKSREMSNDMANMGSNASSSDKQTTTDSKDINDTKESSKIDNTSKSSNKTDNSDKLSDDNKISDNADVKETVTEEIAEDVEENILANVADKLGMTVEDLNKVLEELGLTAMDLLNPDNVNQLVASVKADGDMMALVTDEALTDIVADINAVITSTIEEVSDELGISAKDMMAELENAMNNKDSVVASVQMESNLNKDVVNVKEVESSNADKSEVIIDDNSDQNADVVNVDKAEISQNDSGKKEDNTSDNKEFNSFSKSDAVISEQTVYAQNLEQNQPVFDELIPEQSEVQQRYVDSQNIINQITEQMKVQMKDNITELQMQLNPENLGTVHLTLASKEGNVTAQLTAQNEAVKSALESQIIVLKQNLEEQGVKVEAVEVTVASHEFERNLDQGNGENRQQEEEAERLRKATRKLNLNELYADDSIEALDEAEQVTAKMMMADGNAMDYKI